ncbi:MAG TPA: glycosyltransferase family 4 protein [Bacilli bacterium]|nr:glycosyltransferase family 4 protein [Bacilli bacterium]
MHVLFVYSKGSNKVGRPTIESQAYALEKLCVKVTMHPLSGKGVMGYIDRITQLKKTIRETKPDLIHAHYSYNGFISSFASDKPVITSLMGTDVNGSNLWRPIIRYFMKYKWSSTIMKSAEMKNELNSNVSCQFVVPNGVDLEKFKPLKKIQCRKQLGWDKEKKIILFGGRPSNSVKNYKLASEAFSIIKDDKYDMKTLGGISNDTVPLLLNAADVLLLTSKSEGSPNIIKEAMACNLPIISTDVGDVKWLLEGVENSYITSDKPDTIANQLLLLFECDNVSNGRNKLMQLHLDSQSVAIKIKNIYENVLKIDKN